MPPEIPTPENSYKTNVSFHAETHAKLDEFRSELDDQMHIHGYVQDEASTRNSMGYKSKESAHIPLGIFDRESKFSVNEPEEEEVVPTLASLGRDINCLASLRLGLDEEEIKDIPCRIITVVLNPTMPDFGEVNHILEDVLEACFPEYEELPEPNQEEGGLLTYTLLTTEIPEIRFVSDGLRALMKRHGMMHLIES